MPDQFDFWRRSLAGEKVPVFETEPNAGYYRKPITEQTPGGATKKIGWEPVAFWYEDNNLFCRIGNRIPLVNEQAHPVWLWVAKYPIGEDLYFDVVDNGAPWPDMSAPMAQPSPDRVAHENWQDTVAKEAEVAGLGHNNPPADALAEMREQIESAIGATAGLKISTPIEAGTAQGWRARLNELSKNADNNRKRERAPHDAAVEEIENRYRPLIKPPKARADELRDMLDEYATAMRKHAQAEELARQQAQRDAEAAAAAHAQAAQDRLKAAAEDRPLPPLPPPPPPPPPPAPAPMSQIKGAAGKAATVTMEKFAIVTDWMMLATHYSGNSELRAVLQKLADRDAKAGLQVPGATIDEKAKVR